MPEPFGLSTIGQIALTVRDLDRSIAFYRDILGMKVLWDSVQAGVRYGGPVSDRITGCPGTEQHIVFLGLGESFLELVEYTPTGKPLKGNKASDTGSFHLCFKTDDIQALHARLLENKAAVHCSPQEGISQWVMYFRDPDGIILEAIEGKTKV